jgi:hypothetical protein
MRRLRNEFHDATKGLAPRITRSSLQVKWREDDDRPVRKRKKKPCGCTPHPRYGRKARAPSASTRRCSSWTS